MTFWQKLTSGIKKFFSGGKSSSKPSSSGKASAPAARSTFTGVNRRELINSFRGGTSQAGSQAEPQSQRQVIRKTARTAPVVRSVARANEYDNRTTTRKPEVKKTYTFKSLSDAIDRKSGTATPDPKEAARTASRERLKNLLDDRKGEMESYHAATGHKYDTRYGSKEDRARARQRIKSGEYQSDPKAAKWEYETHPVSSMMGRTAANAMAFGVPDAVIKKLDKYSSPEMREAEAIYRKNQEEHPYARAVAEIGGSLVGFGGTAKATERLGAKAVKRFAPNAAERLAETELLKGAAKRGVEKAVKKGIVKEASEELVKQVGKDKAAKIVQAVGTDIVQNATTGLLYDFNRASEEYEIGSSDWWKEMGKSAAFNAAITGGVAGASMLRSGKGIVKGAANELTARAAKNAFKEDAERLISGAGEPIRRGRMFGETIDDKIARKGDLGVVEFPRSNESAIEVINPDIKRGVASASIDAPENMAYNTYKGGVVNEAQIGNIRRAQAGRGTVSAIDGTVSRGAGIDNEAVERIANASGDAGRRGGDGTLLIRPEHRAKLTESGVTDTHLSDVSDNYAAFSNALDEAKAANAHGGWVDSQSVDDLAKGNARTFLSEDGYAGVAVKGDGDICGVFKNPASKNRAASYDLLYTARANGGTKMDCYGQTLVNRYEKAGYVPVARIPFNPKYVDDPRLLEEMPDVYVLMKNTDDLDTVASKIGKAESAGGYRLSTQEELDSLPTFDDYDEALKYRDDLLAKQEAGAIEDAAIKSAQPEAAKGTKPAAEKLKTTAKNEDVNQFAGIEEDVSEMGFNPKSEEVYQAEKKVENAVNEADTGKSELDKLKDKAYAKTGLNTDGVEKMNAKEQQEFFDSEWRTKDKHTKRGYSTIAVTGDKGFKGVGYDALKNGDTVIDVYHDKENFAKGAQRVMAAADKDGGIDNMIERFNKYAAGEYKMSSSESRDQIYDCIAAVDFANANKDEPWAKDLYLAACKAYAEQTSVSGLSLRLCQKVLYSSPAYRAKAVREQILEMFNRNAGMRKYLGKGKGDKILAGELDDILKKNPALEKVLDELDKMGEATSADEVQETAEKALLLARKSMPMTVLDQLTQWRYVAMLSSPKTHIRNITSNIYSSTLGQISDAMASVTEDRIIKGQGKYGKQFKAAVEAGKINESNYHKSAGGLSWKAFKDSHTGTKTGFTLNRLKSKLETAKLELEATAKTEKNASKIARLNNKIKDLESKIPAAKSAYDDAVKKLERGEAKKALEAWASKGKEELVNDITKYEHRVYGGKSKGLWKANDKLSTFIGDALETSDALSLERIYREKYDKILTANDWSGLSKLAANGDKEAEAAIKQLEEYAAQEAAYSAAEDTYRNYNALSTAMNKFINDSLFNYDAPIHKKIAGGTLHAIMPFTKVPVNLVKRGFDYSPVGLMSAKRNLTKAIESGDVTEINRACEKLAEGRIGTGILMLGAGLGFADPDGDLITGRLSDTDFLDRKRKDAGYQNYAITLGDKNFTLDWATPTASSTFTGVEVGRMLRHAFDDITSKNGLQFDFWKAFDVPMVVASTLVEPTLQLGVFQGINDTLESVVKSDNYDDSGTNVNPALKIIANIAGNYINSQISPAILSSLNRAISPYDYFVTGETDSEYAFNQQIAKMPFISKATLGAKTNVWGEVKNEKKDAGDYAKSLAKNLLSPANINKVTWDETDEYLADMYERTGNQDVFPKNNYKKDLDIGRVSGEHPISMSKKEMAEYNVQRGKAGSDAMRSALNTVIFNRYDEDEKGHKTIPRADNVSANEVERLCREYEGKGIKEVAKYIINTPQFKKASPKEQEAALKAIYGSTNSDESKGAKRSSERYIAEKHGMTADEYDYYNETPAGAQEALKPFIESGQLTVAQALAFTRGASKTYYTTDESGATGGSVTTRFNKKEMMEYLANAGLSYEQAEALYNAYKSKSTKPFSGIDTSSGRKGYSRRRRGYRKRRGGGKSAKPTKVTIKKGYKKVAAPKISGGSVSRTQTSKASYKDMAASLPKGGKMAAVVKAPTSAKYGTKSAKPKSTKKKATAKSGVTVVKKTPPTVKFKKYEV